MSGMTPYPVTSGSGTSGTSGGSTSKTGSVTFTGDSTKDTFVIPHGMGATPSYANVVAKNANAIGDVSVVWDATNITVMYSFAPNNGAVVLTWIVVP